MVRDGPPGGPSLDDKFGALYFLLGAALPRIISFSLQTAEPQTRDLSRLRYSRGRATTF
jgi:hypothetical protein